MTTPREVFDAAVAALRREDWTAVAALCDPASLAAFQRQLLDRVGSERRSSELTSERIMRMHPDMPREVAEYQVSVQKQASDPSYVLQVEVPGTASVSDLRTMDPTAVFAAHLSAGSRERQIEYAQRFTAIPQEVVEQARSHPWPRFQYRFLGVIEDGDRMAYVVYRREVNRPTDGARAPDRNPMGATLPGEEQELSADLAKGHPEIAMCRRQTDGTWRLVASYGLLGQDSVVFSFGEGEASESAPDIL